MENSIKLLVMFEVQKLTYLRAPGLTKKMPEDLVIYIGVGLADCSLLSAGKK